MCTCVHNNCYPRCSRQECKNIDKDDRIELSQEQWFAAVNPFTWSIEQKKGKVSIITDNWVSRKRKRKFDLKVSQNFWSLIVNSPKSDKIQLFHKRAIVPYTITRVLTLRTFCSLSLPMWLIKIPYSCCPLQWETQTIRVCTTRTATWKIWWSKK